MSTLGSGGGFALAAESVGGTIERGFAGRFNPATRHPEAQNISKPSYRTLQMPQINRNSIKPSKGSQN